MGIDRHAEWGHEEQLDREPVRCATDAEVGALPPGALVSLCGGNIWEALGRPGVPAPGGTARIVGIDGITVTMVDWSGVVSTEIAADSVLVRRVRWRGGALRGPVVLVSNSGRYRGRDLLPRAHPNDGLLDVLSLRTMSPRQRMIAWSRSRSGSHLPHGGLVVAREQEFRTAPGGAAYVAFLDGRRFACAECTVVVDPDRWRLALPVPTVGEQ